jgi:2,3-bisphosphoglycerate-dependent phosphoglycerate mutase
MFPFEMKVTCGLPRQPPEMSVFYLIRHAHADWTPDENRQLSAKGRADAERVADVLQRHPIGVICSSPSYRARQTVTPLAARLALPIHIVPDLRERQLGDAPVEDFVKAVEATWDDPTFAYPGGESNCAAQRRGIAVVHKLREQYPAAHIVLSTHGNLLALLLQHFDPSIGFPFWKSLSMPDVYRLDLSVEGESAIRRLWS